jgi:hypothetical protein
MGTDHYGKYYWCVKVKKTISKDGEIYIMADNVVVNNDGSVSFIGKDVYPNLILPAGSWLAVYAASLLDGSAVAVEHWAGEVDRSE